MINLQALQSAWCRETGAGSCGSDSTPIGQCAVTALLVQDLFGGDLVRAEVHCISGVESHYWNRITGIGDIDLTRGQYTQTIPVGEIVPRSRLLEGERARVARTQGRYELLKFRYLSKIFT